MERTDLAAARPAVAAALRRRLEELHASAFLPVRNSLPFWPAGPLRGCGRAPSSTTHGARRS
jgi:hypothetical protein